MSQSIRHGTNENNVKGDLQVHFFVFQDFLLGIWTSLYYALKVASGKNYANQVSSF